MYLKFPIGGRLGQQTTCPLVSLTWLIIGQILQEMLEWLWNSEPNSNIRTITKYCSLPSEKYGKKRSISNWTRYFRTPTTDCCHCEQFSQFCLRMQGLYNTTMSHTTIVNCVLRSLDVYVIFIEIELNTTSCVTVHLILKYIRLSELFL